MRSSIRKSIAKLALFVLFLTLTVTALSQGRTTGPYHRCMQRHATSQSSNVAAQLVEQVCQRRVPPRPSQALPANPQKNGWHQLHTASTTDYRAYDACLLERIRGVKNDHAARWADGFCREQFPPGDTKPKGNAVVNRIVRNLFHALSGVEKRPQNASPLWIDGESTMDLQPAQAGTARFSK